MNRLFISFLLFVFGCTPAFADVQYDSIENLVKQKQGIDKIRMMTKILNKQSPGYPAVLILYGKEAIKFGDVYNSREASAIGQFLLGHFHTNSVNPKEALPFLKNALPFFTQEKDTVQLMHIHYDLATNYELLNNLEATAQHYDEALKNAQLMKNYNAYNSIRRAIIKMYNFYSPQKAIAFYRTQFKPKPGQLPMSTGNLGNLHQNIAFQFNSLEQFDSAYFHGQLALKYFREAEEIEGEAQVLLYLAQIKRGVSYQPENKKLIWKLTQESLKVAKSKDLKVCIYNSSVFMARLYREQQDFRQALGILDSAEALVKILGMPSYYEFLLEEKIELAKAQGDFRYASTLYKEFVTLKDTLYAREFSQKVLALEMKYKTQEHLAEIEALKNRQKVNQLESRMAYLSAGALFLVFGLVFTFGLRQRRKEKRHAENEKQAIFSQLENVRLRSSKIEEELSFKKRQLTSRTLHLSEKSELLQSLEQISHFEEAEDSEKLKEKLLKLKQTIKANNSVEKDWVEFRTSFEEVNGEFFKILKNQFPDLSANELRLASFIRLRLSIRECANILRVEPNTIKTSRYRLKKKLGLESDASLEDFIASV